MVDVVLYRTVLEFVITDCGVANCGWSKVASRVASAPGYRRTR